MKKTVCALASTGPEGARAKTAVHPTPQLQSEPWGGSESFELFRAACECFGIPSVAASLGYGCHSQVSRAYHRKLVNSDPVEARWEAARSKGWLRAMPIRTRKVSKRGIRWAGTWLTAPALQSRIGLQVVVRGNGRGGLVILEGALLAPVCVLPDPEATGPAT